MARRESPIDPTESPLHAFAHDLRKLRDNAGLTYRVMEKHAGFGRSTLSGAASGKSWPSEDVLRAYVGACGGDQEAWVSRLRKDRTAPPQQQTAGEAPPDDGLKRAYAAVARSDHPVVVLLAAVHGFWIKAELGPRLELTGRLPVRLLEYTDPPRALPEDLDVLEIFRQTPHLLVLGEPGAGKTILLQDLARRLIAGWADDPAQPVPVIVPLSSWAQRRPALDAWLVEELFRLYSVDRELAWRWVRARRVLPLLDGLDEVPARHREACVAAINAYRRGRGAVYPLVVTCRTEAYRSLTTPMRPRRIVEVQRLSPQDVRDHLRTAGPDFDGVRQAAERDPELAEMATTPLFLAMITYTYRGRTPPAGTRHALFGDYVTRRLRDEFPGKPELAQRAVRHPERHVLHWLSWLARTMKRTNQTVFLPDLMQADLLTSPLHRRLVRPGVAVLVGLVAAALFGTLFWVAFGIISPPDAGHVNAPVAAGVISAVLSALACGAQCLRRPIEPTLPPNGSATEVRHTVLRAARWSAGGAALGALAGWMFGYLNAEGALGVASYVVVGAFGRHLGGIPGGVMLGALIGLVLGIVNNLRTEPNVRPARPGIGMRGTVRIAMLFGAVTTAAGLLTYGVLGGLTLGTLVALRIGGGTYLCHHMLRLLLWREGVMPRRMLAFLHHQHTLALLTEIGGGYKFTHPLLHDYFAELPPPE